MAAKYLQNLDNPKTAAQRKQRAVFDRLVADYRGLLESPDPEHIELMEQVRKAQT
jgi:hypothetical protein